MINGYISKHLFGHGVNKKEVYGAYKIFFGTLFSESRLKIINLLRSGRKNVSEIMNKTRMNQTAVSHDLARLKKCGFVASEVKGKFRYYKLNEETIKPLMEIIDKHMSRFCVHILRENSKKKKGVKK